MCSASLNALLLLLAMLPSNAERYETPAVAVQN